MPRRSLRGDIRVVGVVVIQEDEEWPPSGPFGKPVQDIAVDGGRVLAIKVRVNPVAIGGAGSKMSDQPSAYVGAPNDFHQIHGDVLVVHEAPVEPVPGIAEESIRDKSGRCIATISEILRECGISSVERVIRSSRKLVWPTSCEHACMGRQSPSGRRTRLIEPNPSLGQFLELGRGFAVVTIKAQAVCAYGVENDEQDVRRPRRSHGQPALIQLFPPEIQAGQGRHRSDKRRQTGLD